MAKRKRKRISTAKKNSAVLLHFLKSERTHFILGVIIAFSGIFMLLAIISFFFTGAADQSIVLNATYGELVRSNTIEVENWTGAGGAFIAERLVNDWFGIFSVLIPAFFIYIGLRFMRVSNFHFLKALFITAFGLICGSITSAFIFDKHLPHSHVKWGGAHGNQVEELLESSIGWPGIVLLIILFIIITVVMVKKSSMYKIQKSLVDNKPSFIKPETLSENLSETEDEFNSKEKKGPGFFKRFIENAKIRLAT